MLAYTFFIRNSVAYRVEAEICVNFFGYQIQIQISFSQ